MAAIRDVSSAGQHPTMAARLASIIQSSHDAVIGETLGRVITSSNPGAERLTAIPRPRCSAATSMCCPAGSRVAEEEEEIQGAIVHGERVEQFLSDRVRKDGSTVRVSMTLSPIADSAGAIVGVSTVSRDISGQQRADARIPRADRRGSGRDGVRGPDGRIALVNAQAERLFGYQRQELEGQLVEMLVPEAARAVHSQRRAGYMADPVPRPMGAGMQLTGRRRDGSTFPAEISLSAIGSDEGTLVMAAVRDVTEQRQQRDELERANRNLESFAYSVAHDLRTPLRALAGYSAALLEDYGDSSARPDVATPNGSRSPARHRGAHRRRAPFARLAGRGSTSSRSTSAPIWPHGR